MNHADLFVLNVGHGSCAIVDHTPSGRLSMIDINNSKALSEDERQMLALSEASALEAKLDDPIGWFNAVFPGRSLFRFVLSHPDADHMEGLHRILGEKEIELWNFWDLPHSKPSPEKFRTPGQQMDWEVYQDYRENPGIDAYGVTLVKPLRADTGDYWTEDELQILSPDIDLIASCEAGTYDSNNMSRILKFQFAGRSVLLPGDAEAKAWNDAASDLPVLLNSDVLVASHHGRRSGYPPDEVMGLIDPGAVVVSAARLPAEHDAIPWYEAVAQAVISTRVDGAILIRIWEDGELGIYRVSDVERLYSLPPLR